MLRFSVATLALMLLAPQLASAAEDGYRAKLTLELKLGDEFFELMQAQEGSQLELDPGDFNIRPVKGNLYLTDTLFRMDVVVEPQGVVMTTIADYDRQVLYMINHGAQMAWQTDWAEYAARFEEQGLPLTNPEQVLYSWDEVYAALEGFPGMSVKDLGSAEVNGMLCHGLHFRGRLEELTQADGFAVLPGVATLKDLSGEWSGDFWIGEELGLPIKMEMTMLGLEYVMDITDVQPWTGIEALFAVPPGYRVLEIGLEELVGGG